MFQTIEEGVTGDLAIHPCIQALPSGLPSSAVFANLAEGNQKMLQNWHQISGAELKSCEIGEWVSAPSWQNPTLERTYPKHAIAWRPKQPLATPSPDAQCLAEA